MKGNAEVVEHLNAVLTHQLTSINQRYIHAKMCANWGYSVLYKAHYGRSIEQMKQADETIARILLLEGVPNMQRYSPVRVGETPKEQHEVDVALQAEGSALLNAGIKLCREKKDNASREILERYAGREEEGCDWSETHLAMIEDMGIGNYLAGVMGEAEGH